jgi:hypothetical protein
MQKDHLPALPRSLTNALPCPTKLHSHSQIYNTEPPGHIERLRTGVKQVESSGLTHASPALPSVLLLAEGSSIFSVSVELLDQQRQKYSYGECYLVGVKILVHLQVH